MDNSRLLVLVQEDVFNLDNHHKSDESHEHNLEPGQEDVFNLDNHIKNKLKTFKEFVSEAVKSSDFRPLKTNNITNLHLSLKDHYDFGHKSDTHLRDHIDEYTNSSELLNHVLASKAAGVKKSHIVDMKLIKFQQH